MQGCTQQPYSHAGTFVSILPVSLHVVPTGKFTGARASVELTCLLWVCPVEPRCQLCAVLWLQDILPASRLLPMTPIIIIYVLILFPFPSISQVLSEMVYVRGEEHGLGGQTEGRILVLSLSL